MAFAAQAPGFRPTAPADPTGLAPSGICICDSGASKGDSPGKASPASREHCAQGEPPAGDAASRGPQGDGPPQWSLRHPPTTLRPHDQTDRLGLLILCAPAPDSGIDPPNHPHPLHSLPQVFSRNRTPFLSGTRWTRQDGSCSLTSTPAVPGEPGAPALVRVLGFGGRPSLLQAGARGPVRCFLSQARGSGHRGREEFSRSLWALN